MKCKHPVLMFFKLSLFLILLSACSVKKLETKDVVDVPLIEHAPIFRGDIQEGTKKSLSILDVYEKYSITTPDFPEIFKQPLTIPNERYQYLLNDKLGRIDEKFAGKQLVGPRLIYLEDISTRKHSTKKEWGWEKNKKRGIKRYYKLFKSPWRVYEYKVAYQLVDKPKPKKRKKTDVKTKKAKEKKKLLSRTQPTKANIMLYFYRLEGKRRIYIIDPDVFIKSML